MYLLGCRALFLPFFSVIWGDHDIKPNVRIYEPLFYKSNDLKNIETSITKWAEAIRKVTNCMDKDHLGRLKALEKHHEVTNSTKGRPFLLNRSTINRIRTGAVKFSTIHSNMCPNVNFT